MGWVVVRVVKALEEGEAILEVDSAGCQGVGCEGRLLGYAQRIIHIKQIIARKNTYNELVSCTSLSTSQSFFPTLLQFSISD